MKLKQTGIVFIIFIVSMHTWQVKAQVQNEEDNFTPYELLSSYYDNDFKPFKKRNWYLGLAFSLEDKQSLNSQGLFQKIIDGNNNSIDLLLKGGYYTGNYGMVGLEVNYYQSKFTGFVFQDPDTLQSNSITRGYSFTPNLRSSVPLTANERLSFFTSVGLGFGIEHTNVRTIKKLDEVSKRFSTVYNFGIGISPGVTFFAMENFAFEVQLDVLGYNLRVTETLKDGIEESRDVRQNVNFSIDILTLKLGLAYYFGAGNKSGLKQH